ncbi:MAG TPA: type III-B CRISPR module-associated Cmr3 family protein [Pirellulales bacterium]|nr:type III-B CRISPR module-associated Cmr3 family protein [Pirellulales bacterium]
MTTSRTIGVVLDPLDVLFFRDGRAFDAASTVGGGLPMPQTLSGAVTSALLRQYGADFDTLAEQAKQHCDWPNAVRAACPAAAWIADVQVRGPWLARRVAEFARIQASDPEMRARTLASPATSHVNPVTVAEFARIQAGTDVEPLVPAPASLHAPKKGRAGELRVLKPLASDALPGWEATRSDGSPPRPLWSCGREPSEPARGYLTQTGLRAFLAGNAVAGAELLGPEKLYQFDHRTGIEIDSDRLTAAESQIYGARFLSLARGVRFDDSDATVKYDIVFYAELRLPVEAPSAADPLDGIDSLAFGGEGRRVALQTMKPFDWPSALPLSAKPKSFLLLTTPGMFAGRWKPAVLGERIVAAAVPGDVPVSGWDMALGGPKPTRFAAAAGSVYFLDGEFDHVAEFARIQASGGAPTSGTIAGSAAPESALSLSDDPRDARQGWGCYLKGVWTDDEH